ncbi:MAG: hypothetical protein K6G11_05110 [Lachnospiraceae bacterium]|nr:hypothetical protein [Lachnospiraceae bacterium]
MAKDKKLSNDKIFEEGDSMEKVYKSMTSVGTVNIVLGILLIVTGIGFGVSIITGGARLFAHRNKVIF